MMVEVHSSLPTTFPHGQSLPSEIVNANRVVDKGGFADLSSATTWSGVCPLLTPMRFSPLQPS